ncbi:MAG: GNAT family N-acetyltransferase [Rubrobacter sp.]|jgi:GNAT superfamily N-acetyltransferase|nr:GNAT family N-acetyltransferase [Rubrobacter sp.]
MKTRTPNITLRPAETSDEEFLFRVYASTREEELSVVAWSEAQKETFLRSQFDAQSRHYREHYPGAEFDVIVADGSSAGRLYVARWKNEIRIMDIALLPTRRGAGIGAKLLEDLISESESLGKPLTIHVERFNPAMRLYERLGFRKKEDKGVYLLMERRPKGGEG